MLYSLAGIVLLRKIEGKIKRVQENVDTLFKMLSPGTANYILHACYLVFLTVTFLVKSMSALGLAYTIG